MQIRRPGRPELMSLSSRSSGTVPARGEDQQREKRCHLTRQTQPILPGLRELPNRAKGRASWDLMIRLLPTLPRKTFHTRQSGKPDVQNFMILVEMDLQCIHPYMIHKLRQDSHSGVMTVSYSLGLQTQQTPTAPNRRVHRRFSVANRK